MTCPLRGENFVKFEKGDIQIMGIHHYGYGYGYSSGADTMATLGILAFIAALVCTVLLMILVTPEKRRAGLNKFFKAVADICNFKGLLLEYIVRALYIFFTIFTVLLGFFALFTQPVEGLVTMILGPIVLRVTFEFTMMFILLVKNVIQINKKLPGQVDDPMKLDIAAAVAKAKAEPKAAETAADEPKMVFCSQCGTQYDASKGGCPNGCKE